jgi:SNF2 family DNA or RNA helicase
MPAFDVKVTALRGTPVFQICGFDQRLGKVYGATYSKEDGLWYFPAFLPASDLVLHDFRALKLQLVFSAKAKEVIEKLKVLKARFEARQLPAGFTFKTEPFEHQLTGLLHTIYYWRCALFYACGLGKSKIVIDWQRAIPGAWPCVVCPKVVVGVWPRELQRHGIDQEYRIVDADDKAERLQQLADVKGYQGIVMSYDTMWRQFEEVAQVPYNCMVLDESHYIKGYNSQRTEVALELSNKAARRIIMSGTPSMGDPRDLWAPIRFLSPALMPEEFWQFQKKYCVTAPKNKHIVIGYKNLDVLNTRVNVVALRKTKEECLDLPAQLIHDRFIHLVGEPRRAYNGLQATPEYQSLVQGLTHQLQLGQGVMIDVAHAAALLNKLIQISCGFVYAVDEKELTVCDGCQHLHECVANDIHPFTQMCVVAPQSRMPIVKYFDDNAKRDALEELLEEILAEPTNKVIIWGQFTPELNLIEELLQKLELGYVRVDGRTSRQAPTLAEKFNTDPECRIWLGQVATGVGLTLNAANYMVYYSLPWKLGDLEQSKDRNHRIGQLRSTTIYRLIARGTVDEGIALALRTKQTVAVAITAAIACTACPQHEACQSQRIEPFDDGCCFPRAVARHVTKAQLLPVADEECPS